ncbi:MAG: diacylglycerol kinase family protein [Defluviitaleaceae bacterium]|nr:diacylglycerol kinase family protein [Defluviitaleaceae bacterium]
MKNHTWRESFKNAFIGAATAFRTERNFKIHFVTAFFTLCAALYLKIGKTELLFIILAMALVFVAETFNTALENAVNHRTGDEYTPWAKAAKDAAAGAVLIAAAFSVAVGLIIFVPRLADAGAWGLGAGRSVLAAVVSVAAALLFRKAVNPWAAAVFSLAASLMMAAGNAVYAACGYALAVLFAASLAGWGEKGKARDRGIARIIIGGLAGILVSLAVFWIWK